jgi:AraC family transcriptional regulator, transcriptional activator of pobA
MYMHTHLTLLNPQKGTLAFRIYPFEDANPFEELQRLSYFSIILIKSGQAHLTADFKEYDVIAPSLMAFSPYQPYRLQSESALQGWVINFHPEFFCIFKHHQEIACNGLLFNNIYQVPYLDLEVSDVVHFESLIEQMVAETQKAELAQYELLIAYLKIVLINAVRLKINQQPAVKAAMSSLKEPFLLQKLKDAIEAHYRTKHSASDYAEMLNITPKALGKITKAHFQKTLTDLISDRIVIEAKRELYLSAKSIKEIAYELGFDDEFYFSRFFKKRAEISPQYYRDTVGFAAAV